jgi:hypothetical protein
MDDSVAEKKRRRNERRAARKRQRYADEPEFREKTKACVRASRRKNKEAINARWRHRYGTDPEFQAICRAQSATSQRKAALKRKYGMSLEQDAAKLAGQGGVCVICLKPKEKRLHVDHNHETRKLRSLLCGKCNRGLGFYDEDSAAMRRAADYVDYWQWRHANPDNTGPPPFALAAANRFLAPTQQTIQYLEPEGDVMTPTDEPTEESKASRMVRRALLHELLQPFDPDPPPPVDMLQAVSRAIVVKASQGDMTAAKEVFDRIDGKTPTAVAPASAETPKETSFARRRCDRNWRADVGSWHVSETV